MGEKTGISWTHHTFNPWWGCLKVSPGCQNCYAEHLAVHRQKLPIWGPAATTRRRVMSESYWHQPVLWDRKAAREVRRARVFCASMADVFEDHPDVVGARERLFTLIAETPHLDWLLLTKRPENIGRMLPDRWITGGLPRNIWLGTSAENQDALDERWSILDSETHYLYPSVLFLSLEPLLGPINLEIALDEIDLGDEDHSYWTRAADWVIVGGESGPNARPMDPRWARAIRDQCQEACVPFFYKQKGGKTKIAGIAGGDLLDGVQHHEFPQVEPIQGRLF